MPLANHAGDVSGCFQTIGDRRFGKWKTNFRNAIAAGFAPRARVEFVPETLLIAAREQSGPGGAAIGARHITVGAADAPLRQRIDVRCGNILATLKSDVGVTKVIGQENDDIRLTRRSGVSLTEPQAENHEDDRWNADHV